MKVLGIDPGYGRLGWGIVEKSSSLTLLDCGLISTQKNSIDLGKSQTQNSTYHINDTVRRLVELSSSLQNIVENYKPDVVSIESLFFFKNQKTVMQVSQARGAILLTIAKSGARVVEYTPLQIKAIVAGDGQADKKAVEKMVRLQLSGIPEGLIDDTLDALAVALTVIFDSSYDGTP